MSIRPMYKTCPYCNKQFTYNPSVGDLGFICPYCRKSVTIVDNIKKIIKIFK